MAASPPVRDPDVLLIAEQFPPAPGGRANLLRDLVRNLPPERTSVSTSFRRGAGLTDRTTPCDVRRAPTFLLGSHGLGRALRHAHLDWGCRRRPPGLVVATGVEPEASLALHLKETRGIPFVLHLEAPQLLQIRSAIRAGGDTGRKCARIVKETEAILVPSRTCWLEAYKLDIHPHHIQVLSPGVDLERFHPGLAGPELARRLDVEKRPVLLTCVRGNAVEDLETVLRAFAVVRGQQKNACLVVLGAAAERSRHELLEKLRIERAVRFLPSVSEAELPEAYRLADVLLAAYREDRDAGILQGMEITLLEALASGLPVVATRTPLTEELVPEGEVGQLVETGAHAKLGKYATDILRSRESRAELALAARARAEESFDAAENGRAFREFLEVIYHRRLGLGTLEYPAPAPTADAAAPEGATDQGTAPPAA